MKITADRGVEIAQAMRDIQTICDKHGLIMLANEEHGASWFEVWARDTEDNVGVVDTVWNTFGEEN